MKTFAEVKKKSEFSVRLKLIILAISVLVAFTVFIVFECVKNPPFSPIGFGFMVFFMLFGLAYFSFAIFSKDLSGYLAGALSLVIGLVLLLAIVVEVKWYITLISAIVLLSILVILLFAIVTPKLLVHAKNEDPEYKNYIERRKEKEQEKQEEVEELPEIKSFKD